MGALLVFFAKGFGDVRSKQAARLEEKRTFEAYLETATDV